MKNAAIKLWVGSMIYTHKKRSKQISFLNGMSVKSLFLDKCKNYLKTVKTTSTKNTFCTDDLKHQSRFFSLEDAGRGISIPSPVDIVKLASDIGVIDYKYLDSFPVESMYYEDILKFKNSSVFNDVSY